MSSIQGYVDKLTRVGASGWAWAPSSPDVVLQVEAILNDRVIGRVAADQLRSDLLEYNIGSGLYGFTMSFDEPITGDETPIVRVLGPEGAAALPGTDKLSLPEEPDHHWTMTPGSVDLRDPVGSSSQSLEGHVDSLTRVGASGWAWAPSSPDVVLQVEAILNDRVIGRVAADQLRSDLLEYNIGSGLYGFTMSFDEPITGDGALQFRMLVPSAQRLKGATTLPALTPADMALRRRGSIATWTKEHAEFTSSGPEFEEFDPSILANVLADSKVEAPLLLAFYLPQFHAIPENDEFWGKGFTEWRQLPRGVSRFPGHYQPRIPRDLGFYDLNNVQTLQAQAKLAKEAGIHAFAFYYYWFNRRRVLEKPLDTLLTSDLDMPFMIIWANENWTRTWDGSESEILLGQDYERQDEDALLQDLARHFLDHRYFRVGGRPLFVIYNPKSIPDTTVTIARWRSILRARFDVEPLMFMAQTFGARDPGEFGLDGALEFPPHKLTDNLVRRLTTDAYSPDYRGEVIAYEDFVSASLSEDGVDFQLIKTVVPSWDNESRRPNRGLTLEGSSPSKYEAWLRAIILHAIDNPVFGVPIVAINAWNEWAEGAYLEPDVYYGASFLNATARAFKSAVAELSSRPPLGTSGKASPAVSVILPNFNHAKYLPERIASVVKQSLTPDEIIFLDDCSSDGSVATAAAILERSGISFRVVVNVENSGCVFKQWIKGISLARNELIWIAETDDFADRHFLSHAVSAFSRDEVMASFGRIVCVDQSGALRSDLDQYYQGMRDFSWETSRVVPAYRAFAHDFAIGNIIPNASGLVFRKPHLTEREVTRLFEYNFAGDWYFYALLVRGGAVAYSRRAKSFFRVNRSSASRSSFSTDRHLLEHQMITQDIWDQYGVDSDIIDLHADRLAVHFPGKSRGQIRDLLEPLRPNEGPDHPIRVCIAAHSFAAGGGEVLPLQLANELKNRGHHITYLAVERDGADGANSIRPRLRGDIPVIYWGDISANFGEFIRDYGIEVFNSHNVSVDHRLYLNKVEVEVPYVASLHGGYETVPRILTRRFVSFLNKTVTAWLDLADKNRHVLIDRGVSPAAFHRSFNAVHKFTGPWVSRSKFRIEHGIPLNAFVFVLCSRAIKPKNWQTAIEVVAALAGRSERPVHLVLIGDGPFLATLKAKNELLTCVTFLGHANVPMRYFRCFDMGIFPSTFSGETFPLFLLECFQAGLPVVASDIGEIPRIMGDTKAERPGATVGHKGSLIRMRREMIEILQDVVEDKSIYKLMRKNARRASRKFSIERLTDFYESKFRDLCRYQAGKTTIPTWLD